MLDPKPKVDAVQSRQPAYALSTQMLRSVAASKLVSSVSEYFVAKPIRFPVLVRGVVGIVFALEQVVQTQVLAVVPSVRVNQISLSFSI